MSNGKLIDKLRRNPRGVMFKLEHECADALEKAEAENARLKAAMDEYSEDETLGKLRGELLLRCCIEICQEESTDNGTAQKIEARIRALKRDVRVKIKRVTDEAV